MDSISFVILAISSLFAVIDPLGGIPFFSGLTSHMNRQRKRRVLIKALLVSTGVLTVFTLFGHQVLQVFGITIEAFRIAGGVIFFGIGLDMLQSQPRRWRTGIRRAYAEDQESVANEPDEEDDPSITPLGIPLLAGPGSITTVMVLVPQAPSEFGQGLVLIALAGIMLLTGVILMGADVVLERIGRTGLKIIEKLMGLLVTVIAVQLMIDGLMPVLGQLVR